AAANLLGYDDLNFTMALSGTDEVTQQLGKITQAWNNQPKSMTLTISEDQINAETRTKLHNMRIDVSAGMNGQVTLTAKDEDARNKMLGLKSELMKIHGKKVEATADLNTAPFEGKK